MSYRLKLRSENVYRGGDFHPLEVGIEDGRIARVGREIGPAEELMDFGGKFLVPGAIDGHVHFRDPGETEKEDFRTGSRAAVRGGVTTVVDMPNNLPPTKSPESLREKKRIAKEKSLVNFGLYAGIPEDLSELPRLADAGALGFKHYMAKEDVDLNRLAERVDEVGGLLTVHAEDPGKFQTGELSGPGDYLDSRPPAAEISGVGRLLERPPERLHLAHVTLPESVERLGGQATTEVTPHHLLLSRDRVDLDDFTAVTNPPIRAEEAAEGLKEAFLAGKIDLLASDHAPHRRSEKLTSNPEAASPGVPGVETLLPLSLTFARERGCPLSLPLDALAKRPAEVFGLDRRGKIEKGYWADIAVLDGDETWEIDGRNFFSKAEVTPFQGWEVSFRPAATFVNGSLVYREGEVVDDRPGKFLAGGSDGGKG